MGSERDDMSISVTSSPPISHMDETSQLPSPITLPNIDDQKDFVTPTVLAFNDILQAAAGVDEQHHQQQEQVRENEAKAQEENGESAVGGKKSSSNKSKSSVSVNNSLLSFVVEAETMMRMSFSRGGEGIK